MTAARMRSMKTRLDLATVLALGIVLSLFSACGLVARGYETDDQPSGDNKPPEGKSKNVLADLERAKDRVAPTYRLGYRFDPGEVSRTRVVHLATVETKIKGVSQNTKSRTVSSRAWKIRDV